MPITFTMPKLSPTMESGTIVKWLKKEGDHVEAGDVLMEVATDKATVEHQALDSGWLRKILVKEGNEASVNEPIALFTESKDESIADYKPPAKEVAPQKEAAPQEEKAAPSQPQPKKAAASAMQQPAFVPEPPLEDYSFQYPRGAAEKKVRASPLAKKIAQEKGLDLSSVKGSGPNLRIMSRDLDKAQTVGSFSQRQEPEMAPGSYEEVAMTPMRKVIGQRLQESKSFIPHFYVTLEVSADNLVGIREQLKNGEIKLTINDFMIRACALALKKHPEINTGFNSVNQTVIQFQTVDIAVAVSVEGGLITPIIRHADFKNLGEISVEVKALANKAKEGKLEPHEYKGGSFTISNLGMFGITDFQAIINPPQAAILAVSGIHEVPVAREGKVVIGKTMNLTLSVDHRVIDGVAASQFLKTLKHYVENPALLIV